MGIHTRNRSTQSTHTPISGAKFDQMLAVSDHSCQSQHDYKGHDCHYLRAKADGANQSARALGSVQLLRVDVVFARDVVGNFHFGAAAERPSAFSIATSASGAMILNPAALGCRPSSAKSFFRRPLSSTIAVK